jgi:hypothetical protein
MISKIFGLTFLFMVRALKTLILLLIRIYQVTLSSVTGRGCRYLPTCSEYASEAIEKHGLKNGGLLAISRICRCHPWGGSGFDPVPEIYGGPIWRENKKAGE